MPKGPRKYDPKAVEQEYVTGDISLRALAAAHGVSFSSLAAYARSNDWSGKRVAYKSALSRRTYETMAAEQGNIKAAIQDESVKVLRATLQIYAEQLVQRKVAVNTKDAVEAIRQLAVLLGEEGGSRDDGTVVVVGQSRTLDADFLRRVASAARGQLAGGVLDGSPPEEPKRTRPN